LLEKREERGMLDDTTAKTEGQMNRDGPPNPDEGESHIQLSDLDDERLLAAFRKVQKAADSPLPQRYVDLAKGSFVLRTAQAELATLIEESELAGTASVTRGKERLAVFGSGSLSVEVVVSPRPGAGSWQLLGQIMPAKAARVQVRRQHQAEQASVAADDLGRFMLDQLTSGPLSLSIEVNGEPPVSTEWIVIGPKD
jgi:hypothetical protein